MRCCDSKISLVSFSKTNYLEWWAGFICWQDQMKVRRLFTWTTLNIILPVTGVYLCVPKCPRVTRVLVRGPVSTLVVLLTVRGVGVEPIGICAGDASCNEDQSISWCFLRVEIHSVQYEVNIWKYGLDKWYSPKDNNFRQKETSEWCYCTIYWVQGRW